MAQQIIIKGTPVVAANEVLVADSSSKIPAVDGSAVTAMAGGNITGTIPTARLDTGTTANKLVVLGGSGLPAVDGSLLTGIVSYTKSASDPTISTNPSTGLGTEWVNHTTGKQFICTDATAGANVWTCSGGGATGNIAPFTFGGTNFGYCSGSFASPAPYSRDWIQKYAFASDADAIDSGNLTTPQWGGAGIGSRTHGYTAGGYYHNNVGAVNVIDNFPFAAGGNATDVGDLTVARNNMSAASEKESYAYVVGGANSGGNTNVIDRFSLTTNGNATDVGDLSSICTWTASSSSESHGYCCQSYNGGNINVIERYAFQATATVSDVGDLHASNPGGAGDTGVTSQTHGYYIRSITTNPAGSDIQKYSLASSASGVLVGDSQHAAGANHQVGASSTTHGYLAGGFASNANSIERFSLSTDGNCTLVGDLVSGQGGQEGSAGTEY